ncbi:MAG: tetratricopeptide repeat protein [Methanosarcinales archaeon]|nr:MAG: tetratricopeptide repeat protein [Methanosarcinales archaeon]
MPESELQRLCLDTLTGGAVQTYVDLIYLIAEGKTDVGTLTRVRAALVQAETSRRRGDTASVISSYADAARIFADKRNPRTSIYFLERSLDIAKLTNNHVAEMESYHLLGEAYEALGDAERALTFHEAHRELASTVGDSSEKAAAATQLVRVYTKQASDAEARGDTEVALKLYLAAADAAGASQQPATQLEPLYSAGKTFVGLGKAAEAIPLLQQYVCARAFTTGRIA